MKMICTIADIGNAVRLLRTCSGLTQSQLAERLNNPRSYVSKIETGAAIPTLHNIYRLAAALDVSAAFLVTIATA